MKFTAKLFDIVDAAHTLDIDDCLATVEIHEGILTVEVDGMDILEEFEDQVVEVDEFGYLEATNTDGELVRLEAYISRPITKEDL